VSRKVDYSHCASSGRGIVDVDEPLPIIPTPSQNLSVGDKVYTHGGDSVKVQMSKIYSGSCLGAPVYIPLPVPDSDQLVASPVGQ
ncbi:19169_t:CDS:2, partial [Funneliformis geosporum]